MALNDSSLRLPPLEMKDLETEQTDHRKRKRNRMRASCLNCYASKRKCDKKRPCARCVRLGTTGLCVYETGDPAEADQARLDEINRLRHRVAELESLARELRNNPHPRWTAPGGVHHDPEYVHFHPKPVVKWYDPNIQDKSCGDPGSLNSEPELSHLSVSLGAAVQTLDKANATCGCNDRLCNSGDVSPDDASSSHPNTSDSVRSPSRSSYDTDHPPRWACDPVGRFEPPSVERNKKFVDDHGENPCNCIKDQAAFAPLVNLSVALRTSREALEYLHPTGVECDFYSRIILLESHIFSLSPQETLFNPRSFGAFGASSSCMNTETSSSQTTVHPHPLRPLPHTRYLAADRNSHDQLRGLDPLAYLDHPFVQVYGTPRK